MDLIDCVDTIYAEISKHTNAVDNESEINSTLFVDAVATEDNATNIYIEDQPYHNNS